MHTYKKYLVFLLMLMVASSVAAADDYLKLLEAEANKVNLDNEGRESKEKFKSQKKLGTKNNWVSDTMKNNLPKNLSKEELASIIESRFSGTFVLYKELGTADKNIVYLHYKKSAAPNMKDIRKDIYDRLKY